MTALPSAPSLVCFGELLLRLTVPDRKVLADASSLHLHFGGAEANVAVQFAELGGRAAFVSSLPENRLATTAIQRLTSRGVDVRWIQRGGSRMGLYFLEAGAGLRSSIVTYDRANSAIAAVRPGMIPWDDIFKGARWFHWSGITPALSEHAPAVCREACEAAHRHGLTVSFDINYRATLWSREAAANALVPLMPYVHHCICGPSEAQEILGAEPAADADSNEFEAVADALARKYKLKSVAMTVRRGNSASRTRYRGMLFTNGTAYYGRNYGIDIVDRIATGDAFTGGFIHASLEDQSPQDVIDLATACGAWKHTIYGDWNHGSLPAIRNLAQTGAGASVLR